MIQLASIILIIYLALIGLQDSISDSWYVKRHLRWLFFLTLTLVGALLTAATKELDYNYLFFLAGMGAWVVAVAPNFKTEGLVRLMHYLGAGTIILCGYLGIGLAFGGWWYAVALVLLAGITYWVVPKRKMYWFEIVAFSGLMGFLNSVL